MTSHGHDVFAVGAAYEPYVGRWSRRVAREFLRWLAIAPHSSWLDVGCGTGALSQTILETAAPRIVKGIDRSDGFVQYARAQVSDSRVSFEVGDAQSLPEQPTSYDAVVSGLVLNFVPSPEKMVAEMARVAKPGGTVALYVWDYADQMQLMRHFWDAAVALDAEAQAFDEGRRFSVCQPEPLAALFHAAGLHSLEVRPIVIPTDFANFDDYWTPFLGGQGSAPGYTMSLTEEQRSALRERLRRHLPIETDGSIHLIARAWAVRGTK
ncbi:MAG: methyltransferase domain-containing protein, partial [Chloroflexota bacterium]